MLVASSARLSWRTLERRLSALRLVGLTAGQVRLITAVEAAGVAAARGRGWCGDLAHHGPPFGPVGHRSGALVVARRLDLAPDRPDGRTALISLTALTSQIGLRRLGLDPLRVRAEGTRTCR